MLGIDLIGLLATICLIGIRYPHYVLLATGIHEVACIFVAVFLHGQIDYIVTAGAFGMMAVSNYNSSIVGILILCSGSVANYIISSISGGIGFESSANLINPWAQLKFPFAVINFRLCILSSLIQIWRNFT